MTTYHFKSYFLTILVSLALSVSCGLRAQHLQATLAHYSSDDGLPSNAIAHLEHDDYGYVWIATWNGISRFDGYNFYNYRTGVRSGVRGLHNRVESMVIDRAQNVWLKMYDGRIFTINRKTDRIEDPMEGVTDHEDFHVDYFFTPYVTSTGDVLVSYDNVGLYKLRLDRGGYRQDRIMTGKLDVYTVVEGYRNDIWVGTNQGVHRINMSNLSLERKGYFLGEHITQMTSNGYNIFVGTKSGKILQFSYGQDSTLVKDTGREITGLFVDSHGTLWFSDLGNGAYRLKPETGDVKFFSQRVPTPEFTSRGAEFGEALGKVWIRLNHGGYGYYNREADEVEYFHNDPSNSWNLSNTVNARLEMDDGVIWESTIRRGFEKLEIMKNTIPRKILVPDSESMLDNEIRAICYDTQRHQLLLGNKHGALFIIGDDGKRTVLTHDSSGNPFGRFYGITCDSKGNYWLCDKDNGVYKMTPSANGYNITNFRHQANDPWSLSSNSAYQAAEDQQGNIWIATYGGGVNVLVKDKEGHYKAYHRKNKLKRYPASSHQRVRTIAVDKDGIVWAGTTDGILLMSLQKDEFSVQKLEQPERPENGLASNDIVCLACDQQGIMWVGTNSGGLSRTTTKDDQGTWQFESYGIEQGLPSEEVRSITFDNKDNVWLATDHILCSFNIKKKIITTFSSLDGVDDTMCSEGAATVMSNGNIIFGTFNGYYVVDRSKLSTKTGSLLKLRITDFYYNEELQSPRLNNTFDHYIPESRRVVMPKHNGSFSFRFAALNYQFQHRIHYQYKLGGYDNDWRNAGKDRMAIYDGVPAGTYLFQVKAFLLEAPESYDIRTIEVVVPPYFLLSPAAIWLYLLIVAVVALTLLWRHQEKLRHLYHQQRARQDAGDGGSAPARQAEGTASADEHKDETDTYEIIED